MYTLSSAMSQAMDIEAKFGGRSEKHEVSGWGWHELQQIKDDGIWRKEDVQAARRMIAATKN